MRQVVDFNVSGMQSEQCAKRLHDALSPLPGVKDLSVSLSNQRVRVVYDSAEIHVNHLQTLIRDQGFSVPSGCP
jgi:copper chaperone CopZ